jgi:hypothetical protein
VLWIVLIFGLSFLLPVLFLSTDGGIPWEFVAFVLAASGMAFFWRARPIKVHVTGPYYAIYRKSPRRRLETGLHKDLSFFWDKFSFKDGIAIRGEGKRFAVPYFSNQDARVVNEFCKKYMGREHNQLGL